MDNNCQSSEKEALLENLMCYKFRVIWSSLLVQEWTLESQSPETSVCLWVFSDYGHQHLMCVSMF